MKKQLRRRAKDSSVRKPIFPCIFSVSLILSLCLSAFGTVPAFAGQCDGTAGDDVVVCSADPIVPDAEVGLDMGDDTYTQDPLVVSDSVQGDALANGSANTGDGGDDTITIDGLVFVVTGDSTDGNGGDDTIVINGIVLDVLGDDVTGNGGDDLIIINGEVVFDVTGDCASTGDGGDDTIVVNGIVDGNVEGDCVGGNGGNDTIMINGTVGGDVLGDVAVGAGGNDTVILGAGADVAGLIDGEDGSDVLQFTFLSQDALTGLDPAGGSLTYNGHTYTWANFEQLVGLLEELGVRFFYRSHGLAALALEDGVKVVNANGPIAFIHYSELSNLVAGGAGQMFQGVHAQGWYIVIHNLGAYEGHAGQNLYSVQIYNATGGLMGEFDFGYQF